MYSKTAEDIKKFTKKVTEDMQSDLSEWLQENMFKMLGGGFDVDEMARLAGMFGGLRQGGVQLNPYEVLGLDRNCTDDEVKKRYRELMAVVHPDRTQGKTSYFAALVNKAYDQICKIRGIK